MFRHIWVFAFVVSFLVTSKHGVEAWGKDGHQIVANIAYQRLSPATQDAVKDILRREDGSYGDDDATAGSPLASVASWADKVRFTKAYHWTTPLHYIDIRDDEVPGGCPCEPPPPKGETQVHSKPCYFIYERDCVNDFCAAGAISNYTTQISNVLHNTTMSKHQLRGNGLSRNRNRVSLMFVTHFVGDIHQPLHSSRSSDKGGNTFHVTFDNQQLMSKPFVDRNGKTHSQWNLHSVWDEAIIDKAMAELYQDSREAFEGDLLDKINDGDYAEDVSKWLVCADGRDKTCTSQWAEESFIDALEWAYRNTDGSEVVDGSHLDSEYYSTRLEVVKRRLAAAGVRLAASIEASLATVTPLDTNPFDIIQTII
eukprot:scaffold80008_cov47-Attheya_sp.AAC.4